MILLVDMDAFFASVEQAHHPHLRGRPVIVCGDPSRRGVVTAASYEARPFGVRAGMPLGEARQCCPQADYVEGNPDKYVAISVKLLELYLTYTPDVEPFSVDEAFVGFPRGSITADRALAIARELQERIQAQHGITASIGIGPNKLVAKMAAGLRKPNGRTALDEAGFREAFAPLDVQELWGVGPKLAERMRSLGIKTVGDLARAPESLLKAEFGIIGPQLREAANGYDETPLIPYHQGIDAKSVGHEVTLPEDCVDPEFLEGTLLRLSDQVARRMRGEGYVGRTVALKLRNARFETLIRQRVLREHTADPRILFEAARALWRRNWKRQPLRLLGVSVSSIARRSDSPQAELFERDVRTEQLTAAMDAIRDRLGEASLVPAGSLTHRRRLGHVPFGPLSGRVRQRESALGAEPGPPARRGSS